jgi:hypothetical protein
MAPGSKFVIVVFAVLAIAGTALLLGSRLTAQGGNSTGGGGDSERDLIAVTGTYGSGASVLYLIDVKTRHLAVYKTDNGRKVELVAARNIKYDLMLDDYNDMTDPAFSPEALRRAEPSRTGPASRPGRETPSPR